MKLTYVTAAVREKAELRNYVSTRNVHPLPPPSTPQTRLREATFSVYDI